MFVLFLFHRSKSTKHLKHPPTQTAKTGSFHGSCWGHNTGEDQPKRKLRCPVAVLCVSSWVECARPQPLLSQLSQSWKAWRSTHRIYRNLYAYLVHMSIYKFVCVYVCMYVSIYLSIYVWMYVCMHVCMDRSDRSNRHRHTYISYVNFLVSIFCVCFCWPSAKFR